MTITRRQLLHSILGLYAIAVLVALGSLLSHSRFFRRAGKTQPGSVAIVRIYGPIRTSMSSSGLGSYDADDVVKRLHDLSEDDDVKAIVLRINSPGGTVGAVQEINAEISKCKAKGKKVVASLGDVAASGGYYLAASADKIVTNPGTITGSIGVIMQFGNFEGLFQKLGVSLQVVKSGAHKDIGSPARPLTAEERRLLQASIDDAYAQFVDAVAKGRGMAQGQVLPLADGRIFTGRQAKLAGLVDEMGDSVDALEIARKLAHLDPHCAVRTDTPKSLSGLIKRMSSAFHGSPLESLGVGDLGVTLEYALR